MQCVSRRSFPLDALLSHTSHPNNASETPEAGVFFQGHASIMCFAPLNMQALRRAENPAQNLLYSGIPQLVGVAGLLRRNPLCKLCVQGANILRKLRNSLRGRSTCTRIVESIRLSLHDSIVCVNSLTKIQVPVRLLSLLVSPRPLSQLL